MITALVSKEFIARFGAALEAEAKAAGKTVVFMTLPAEKGARLSPAEREKVEFVLKVMPVLQIHRFVLGFRGRSDRSGLAS